MNPFQKRFPQFGDLPGHGVGPGPADSHDLKRIFLDDITLHGSPLALKILKKQRKRDARLNYCITFSEN
jgi:hypothetical protein